MQNLVDYIREGGAFMYPIIGCALWACALLIERTLFYLQTASRMGRMRRVFFEKLAREGTDEAARWLGSQKESLFKAVLQTALVNRHLGAERVERTIETVLLRELPAYSRYLNLLSTLAGLMPIFGLLGTVSGMIATFKVIALQGTGDAQAMAAGIAEALLTTQAGLVAAAPIILGHTLLRNRLRHIVDILRESSTLLVDHLKGHHA
jgi:biopolymer transport protein ExbB